MKINFDDYRTSADGRLMTVRLKKDGVYQYLVEKYPMYTSLADMVYCYEHSIPYKACSECGAVIKTKSTYCKHCSAAIFSRQNVKFAIKAITGKPSPNKGKTFEELGVVHVKYTNPEKWEEAKAKISNANTGSKNGMYGTSYTDEQRAKQSKEVRTRIQNGEFTPKSNNRNTHFTSYCNEKVYRSSWEAAFASTDLDMQYEKLRLPYVDCNGKHRIYIVDFISDKNKTIYEVRPIELFNDEDCKSIAAKNWCKENGYKFVHIGISELYDIKHKIKFELLDNDTIRKVNDAFSKENKNR